MDSPGNLLAIVLIVMFWIVMLSAIVAYFFIWRACVRAIMNGCPVQFVSIRTMRPRGVPPVLLVDAYTALRRAAIETSVREVEESYLDHRTRVRTSQDLIGLVKSKASTKPATTA
jgi:uncharacterized protein YqfA (UPF0365 family)